MNKRYKKYFGLNSLILAVILLIGLASFYYLYHRIRTQKELYVSVSLLKPRELIFNAPLNWLPFWIAKSVAVGDREVSPLGAVNAQVIQKDTYDSVSTIGNVSGQFVYLLLKMNAIRDRSGIYLFKNKPLSIGSVIDLKLSSTNAQGLVTGVFDKLPKYEYKKMTVVLKGKQLDSSLVANIKAGQSILFKDALPLVKILTVNISGSSTSELRSESVSGRPILAFDQTKKDVDLTAEILVKKIDADYYYTEQQKVKVGEWLQLPFSEVTLSLPISSIIKIEDIDLF